MDKISALLIVLLRIIIFMPLLAREKAIADAETKAEQLADLADVRLGKPIYINEAGGYIPIIREYPARAEGIPVPAPAPTPISPGETEVSLTIQVAYSIK